MLRRIAKAAAAVFVFGSLILPPPQAQATDYCNQTDHGFWMIRHLDNGYGSQAQVSRYNWSLVSCGTGPTQSAHTTGVRLTADWKDFLEVGVIKNLSSYKVFGEWRFWPVLQYFTYGNSTGDGGAVGLKANNVPGTWDWKIWWDPNGGTNFTLLDTFASMSSQYGNAWGEASRNGKTGTSIDDDHWDMYFKNSDGIWNLIGNLDCGNQPLDADAKVVTVSSHEFRVRGGNGTC